MMYRENDAGFESAAVSETTQAWARSAASAGEKPQEIVSQSGPFINEFHYANSGADTGEFVEIATPVGISLAGYSLFFYDGATGTFYRTATLDGRTNNPTQAFAFATVQFAATDQIENGPDAIALVNAAGQVVEFLSYGGTVAATNGPAAGLTSTNVGVTESDGNNPGSSIARVGQGDSGSEFFFTFQSIATPNSINNGQTFSTNPPAPPPPPPPGGSTFNIADDYVSEPNPNQGPDQGILMFEVRRSSAVGAASVGFSVGPGPVPSADASDLVRGFFQGTVNFADGQRSAFILVQVQGDNFAESNENVTVTLNSPVNGTIADGSATGTIFDNDGRSNSGVTFSISNANVTEADPGMNVPLTFTVTRSSSVGAASVDYGPGNGTSPPSADPDDFVPGTPLFGTVRFVDGQTSATITLQVQGDDMVEGDEVISILLSNPQGGGIFKLTGFGTIFNDDFGASPPPPPPPPSGTAGPTPIFQEREPNDTQGTAQFIDRSEFRIDSTNTNLEDRSLPSATVRGTISSLTERDFFSFTLQASETVILDIDGTSGNFDSEIDLFDSTGRQVLGNNDRGTLDNGSNTVRDSFLTYTAPVFTAPGSGTYAVAVGSSFQNSIGGYSLNISIRNARPITAATATSGNDVLTGTEGDDTINGLGGDDRINGLGGNDRIDGGTGNDRIDAGAGNDVASGGDGDDVVGGGDGDDTLYGDAGSDTLFGDAGMDLLDGGIGNDRLDGGADNDVVGGGEGNDVVGGNTGDDTLYGDAGDDELFGDAGADRLDGGVGNDKVNGGEGNDVAGGNAGDDRVFGDAGDDELFGDAGNDVLDGGIGNDRLDGGADDDFVGGGEGNDVVGGNTGDDFVYGDAGSDELFGDAGNDRLFGGTGNDVLVGGAGADRLEGGAGADVFRFGSASESTGRGFDTLVDFSFAQGDRIDLPGAVGRIDDRASGTLNNATFDADLSSALGGLGGGEAALFDATGGEFAGRTFLIVDGNGAAGYQAGEDFVFLLESTPPAADLTPVVFI